MKATLKIVGGPLDGAFADVEVEMHEGSIPNLGVFPLGDHLYTMDMEAGTLTHSPEPDPSLDVAKMNNVFSTREILETITRDQP